MSRFIPRSDVDLKGKIVVLTGGSSGIGAAVIESLYKQGACVVFGDVQVEKGESLTAKLSATNVKFMKTDVTKYSDLIRLFDKALECFGRVDVAISIAGIMEAGNFVDPYLDLKSVKEAPPTRTLNVNLLGSLYFSRIAAVYLRQGFLPTDDKALILLSSVAGFKETPGMPVYQAAKHGVLGLMRCLRLTLPASGIRINAVCPWFVDTIMTAGIRDQWVKHNLPINDPPGVAALIIGIACEKGMNGKAIYVEGNRGWEIEEGIYKLEPEWMGVEPSKELNKGQELMGSGEFWQAQL